MLLFFIYIEINQPLDVVFLLDTSASVSRKSIEGLQKFLINALGVYQISPDKVNVGIVIFGRNPKILVNLKDGNSFRAVFNAIKKITFTGNAI